MRFLRAPLAALALVSSAALVFACAAERVSLDEDPDAGVARTPRDAATPTKDAAIPDTDASRPADASADAPVRDASVDAPAADAQTDAAIVGMTISEIFAADILSRRYVEIAGPASTPLGELELRVADATGAVLKTVAVASAPADVMPTRGTWVVGGLAGTSVDHGVLVSMWDLPADNGTVQLVRRNAAGTTLLDVVGYGTTAAQVASAPTASKEGTAAITPGGRSLLRRPPQTDTGNNATDFCRGAASPNAVNVCDF